MQLDEGNEIHDTLYSVKWGLLQYRLEQAGIISLIDGFNDMDYATFLYKQMPL